MDANYRYRDYDVSVSGTNEDADEFNQLAELYSIARAGAAIRQIPGRAPTGFDHTEDSLCTRYVDFTHGSKPRDGWYLLMPGYSFFEDVTPMGFAYNFSIGLFYLGRHDVDYQMGYRVKSLSRDIDNDWGI